MERSLIASWDAAGQRMRPAGLRTDVAVWQGERQGRQVEVRASHVEATRWVKGWESGPMEQRACAGPGGLAAWQCGGRIGTNN